MVVIPKALAVEVLLKTEEIVKRENGMRAGLSKGITVSEVYKEHGKFWNEKWMGVASGQRFKTGTQGKRLAQ